jgi:molybdopterin converting factor small subunit
VDHAVEVTVELYGIARLRAGKSEVTVHARTAADMLAAVERVCPALAGLVQSNGRLAPQYLLSVDGRVFESDMQRPLKDGERLLLLGADAGG